VRAPVDRRVAVVTAVVAAAALAATIVIGADAEPAAPALPPAPLPGASDAGVRAELLDRARRGRRAEWAVRYDFERETPAGTLRARTESVHRPPDALTAGFGSVRGTWRGRTVDCADGPTGKVCAPSRPSTREAGGDALAAATDPGRGPYTVQAAGWARVAGVAARCFRLVANGRPGRTVFGLDTTRCFTRDGIVTRDAVRRADSRDVSTARRVRRAVTDRDFGRLLRGYPIDVPAPTGSTVAP
jgi:hypothetical protein